MGSKHKRSNVYSAILGRKQRQKTGGKGQVHKKQFRVSKDPVTPVKTPAQPEDRVHSTRRFPVYQFTAHFWATLDVLEERMFGGRFFDKLDKIRDDAIKEAKRLEAYRERRAKNEYRAGQILRRLRRVEAIDLFMMTQHITPDWFGEKHLQFKAVAQLYEKKDRILWYLRGLYHYLAFDHELPGWSVKKGLNAYSRHRKLYNKHLAGHHEKLRQAKWDLKRVKVRARRRKLEEQGIEKGYGVRRGMGINVPVPVPVIEEAIDPIIEHIIEDHINWDN